MNLSDDEWVEQYFEICKRIYEQMERDNSFPWDREETEQDSNQNS